MPKDIPVDNNLLKPDKKAETKKTTAAPVSKAEDDFLSLIGVPSEGLRSAQETLKLVAEAGKSEAERRNEINTGIADPENEITKTGRAWGAGILEGNFGDNEQLNAELGPELVKGLRETKDPGERLGVIRAEMANLESGPGNIFKPLRPSEQTPEEGERRAAGQRRCQLLKTMVVGAAEHEFNAGGAEGISEGWQIVKSAGINFGTNEPGWLTAQIAGAVEKIDIETDERGRKVLADISGDLGVIAATSGSKRETPVDGEEATKATPKESIRDRAFAAKEKQNQLERAENERVKAEKYKEDLEKGFQREFTGAEGNGKSEVREYLDEKPNHNYYFDEIGGNLVSLAAVAKSRELRTEAIKGKEPTFNGREVTGLDAKLNVLGRIVSDQEFQDQAVAYLANQQYAVDFGGKSKNDYDRENRSSEWTVEVRRRLLAEAKGSLMGTLEGLLEYNPRSDRGYGGDRREELMVRCMEMMGGGKMIQTLTGKPEEMDEGQQAINGALRAYVAEIQKTAREGQEDWQRSRAKEILGRLGQLTTLASRADLNVLQNEMKAKERGERQLIQDESDRKTLEKKAAEGREDGNAISMAKAELGRLMTKADRIGVLNNEVLSWVAVGQTENNDNPLITLGLRRGKEPGAFKARMETVQSATAVMPADDPRRAAAEIEVAQLEVDFDVATRLEAELAKMQQQMRDNYRGRLAETGSFFNKKNVATVNNEIFQSGQYGMDLGYRNELPRGFRQEVESELVNGVETINNVKFADQLAALNTAVAAEGDILTQKAVIERVTADLKGRRAKAESIVSARKAKVVAAQNEVVTRVTNAGIQSLLRDRLTPYR